MDVSQNQGFGREWGPLTAQLSTAAPGLISGGSDRDCDWSLEKHTSEAQQKEEIFTAKASPGPISQLCWCSTLPAGKFQRSSEQGTVSLLGSHCASLTSSTRSWMNRREEPEPLIAPRASRSTVFARCRFPTTSSTLPSTAFARFLGKCGKRQGVSVGNCRDWKSRLQGQNKEA